MRNAFLTVICVVTGAICGCDSSSPATPEELLPKESLERYETEFESSIWGMPKAKEPVQRELSVVQTQTLRAVDLPVPVRLIRLMATARTKDSLGWAYRLVGVHGAESAAEGVFFDSGYFSEDCGNPDIKAEFGEIFQLQRRTLLPVRVRTDSPGCVNEAYKWHEKVVIFDPSRKFIKVGEIELFRRIEDSDHPEKNVLEATSLQPGGSEGNQTVRRHSWESIYFNQQILGGSPLGIKLMREGRYDWNADQTAVVLKAVR